MMNAGAIDLTVPIPGMNAPYLTKTLEWSLRLCILDFMFDSQFLLRRDFVYDTIGLKRRFRILGIMNLCLSPFVLIFMITFFFLRNAETFYHQPGSIGQRRWSELARWRFREFNELPHIFETRLQYAAKPATEYVDQFPSHFRSLIAKFVTFVAGSFAAFLILLAFIDESLLEARIQGKTILWYAAILGTVLAVSRTFISDNYLSTKKFEPERKMRDVVQFTHYLPSHWCNQCHSQEVISEFENEIFEYKAVVFLREIASIIVTPLMLIIYLPRSSSSILSFIQRHTVSVDGVGDVCSLAAFSGVGEFLYPHCKVERALVSFQGAYPSWTPQSRACNTFLKTLEFYEKEKVSANSVEELEGYYHDDDLSGEAVGHGPSILTHRRAPLLVNHSDADAVRPNASNRLSNDEVLSQAHRQSLIQTLHDIQSQHQSQHQLPSEVLL